MNQSQLSGGLPSPAIGAAVRRGAGLRLPAVPSGSASRAGSLLQLIDRLDGVKMILPALTALVTVVLVRRVRLLPPWLGWIAVMMAAALIVSGLGYLLLDSGLAAAASASLPLLLLWICATGIVLGRRSAGTDGHGRAVGGTA